MRVIIIAGEDFNDYERLTKEIIGVFKELKEEYNSEIEIVVSDELSILDSLTQYALDKNYKLEKFITQWRDLDVSIKMIGVDEYGEYNLLASIQRNQDMINYAKNDLDIGVLVAFWDGLNFEVKDILYKAKEKGLKIYIFFYKN